MEMKTSVIPTLLPTLITGCVEDNLGPYKGNKGFRGQQCLGVSLSLSNTASSFTFPTMKAPCILFCSHSDLGLFHQKDTEKLLFFYTSIQKGQLFVWIQLSQPSQPKFLPKEPPEPRYLTGEATKGKTRNILAQTQIPQAPCHCLTYSSFLPLPRRARYLTVIFLNH